MSSDRDQFRRATVDRRREAAGKPVVYEGLRTRSLRFDLFGVQSSMRRSAPIELHLSYTQAMMAFQLFQQATIDILIVGLGGGSLSKYCFKRFPSARVTTIEIDARVIALRERFAIPPDSERFQIVYADAAEYLSNKVGVADVILLDGFDAVGLPQTVEPALLRFLLCRAALRRGTGGQPAER